MATAVRRDPHQATRGEPAWAAMAMMTSTVTAQVTTPA